MVGKRRQEVVLKSLVAMPLGARYVAKLGQEIAHAAMRMDMVGIDPQRRFEMNPGCGFFAGQEQQVRQIDVAIRVARMVPHGFAEQRPRRVSIPGFENERAEVVERAEIGRPTADELQIIVLGFLEIVLLSQQTGAFAARFIESGSRSSTRSSCCRRVLRGLRSGCSATAAGPLSDRESVFAVG